MPLALARALRAVWPARWPVPPAARCWALAALPALAALLVPAPASAQTRVLDSLRRVVARPVPPPPLDTARVLALGNLCWLLRDLDAPAARRYGEQGLALARRTGFAYGELRCLFNLGSVAELQQDLTVAAGYFQAVLRRARPQGRSRRFENPAYIALGNVALMGQQYAAAGRYYRQGLALATARHDSGAVRIATGNLLNYYSAQLSDYARPPDSLVAQTVAWTRRLLTPGVAPVYRAMAYSALAEVATARQRPDSAAYFGQRAAADFRAAGENYNALLCELHLADAYLVLGRPAAAATLAARVADAARAAGLPDLEADTRKTLGRALLALGQPRAAYQAQARAVRLSDSLQTAEGRESLARAEASFGRERQNRRITELDRAQAAQRQQLLLAGALLLALAVGGAAGGVLYLRLRRSRAVLAAQNQALARTRATQDRLYAVIGHDLRSPLAALHLAADVLARYRTAPDPALLDALTAELRGTTGRVMGLLDNLLHWAAAQAGELQPRPQPLAAAALLHETAALFGAVAAAQQVSLALEAPPGLPPLLADRNMTLAILRNLVSNALRVAPPGSTLALSAARAAPGPGPARLALHVRDAGPGLSAARLIALQADAPDPAAPAARRPDGTGLGLPLVRLLAARQGGSFGLESAPGQGTTATLWLPVGS